MLPPGIRRVRDDEDAERACEDRGVERLEDGEARGDAERAAGQEARELAPVDVPAAAADDRGGGDDADEAPRGREDFHREDEREERQAERAAEAERAAQREVQKENAYAIGELRGGKSLEHAAILRKT
jgi:hypothetical protein